MKILKFKKFNEGAIRPTFNIKTKEVINANTKYTIDELNILFNSNNSLVTKFMLVDEFKTYLKTEKEIAGVPDRPMTPNIRFGVYLEPIDTLVVCLTKDIVYFDINEIELIDEVLRHESIHREQSDRSGGNALAYSLERSPVNNPTEYFSHHTELMAFARSYVDQCMRNGQIGNEIMNNLRSGFNGFSGRQPSWIPNTLKSVNISDKDFKRFKKYVYQYIIDDEKKE